MICHYCCRGYITDGFDVRPCPECGGSGFIHCCEGERPDQCPKHAIGAWCAGAAGLGARDVRELYVQTRRQLKALAAVLELEGLE